MNLYTCLLLDSTNMILINAELLLHYHKTKSSNECEFGSLLFDELDLYCKINGFILAGF